jgi:hypothetical protein
MRFGVLRCRSSSDSDSDADDERQALVAQIKMDPDEIFKLHQKTCPLNEVFSSEGEPPRISCTLPSILTSRAIPALACYHQDDTRAQLTLTQPMDTVPDI